ARPASTRKRAGSSDARGPFAGPWPPHMAKDGFAIFFDPSCSFPFPERTMSTDIEKAPEALQQLVADSDTGGRKPTGITAGIIFTSALLWALFQFWYASPLPFTLGIFILNDTEARAIHLAFAMFLAFLAWPAFKGSPRKHVPVVDWVLALAGAFAAAYLMIFYAELATRPGQPTLQDVVVASIGLLLLLEATRRAVGWPM